MAKQDLTEIMHNQMTDNEHVSIEMESPTLANLPERVRSIAALRGLGYSFREIAEELHITPQAVSLMLTRYRRSLTQIQPHHQMRGLSARAVNVLARNKITTPDLARAVNLSELLRQERNCGRKTIDEITRWAALADDAIPPAVEVQGHAGRSRVAAGWPEKCATESSEV